MDYEDTIPLHIPLSITREDEEEALNDRLTLFAEYVDVAKLMPQED